MVQPAAPPSLAPRRGRPPKAIKADFSLLSEENRKRLQDEAQAEVLAEKRRAAEEAYKAAALVEARRDHGVDEEMVKYTLDLPEFCDRIVLDSVIYMQGGTYTVPRSVYDSMREIAGRAWDHYREIKGEKKFKPQPLRNQQLTPHGVINTTSSLMRA